MANEEADGKIDTQVNKDGKTYPPKTRIAMITGYNGSEFSGSQKNPDVRTVEEEIEKALYKLDAIAPYNFGDLKKISWNRATRTDKRVHALQNVFSCKVHIDRAEDEEVFRARLNALLPPDVKVFCVVKSSNRFNAKMCTSNREYSYYLPSFMLTKIKDLYFGTGKSKTKPEPAAGEEEEKKEPVVKAGGIKIMKTDDEEPQYYEAQDAYFNMNLEHVPEEQFEKLYAYRLPEGDRERLQKLF